MQNRWLKIFVCLIIPLIYRFLLYTSHLELMGLCSLDAIECSFYILNEDMCVTAEQFCHENIHYQLNVIPDMAKDTVPQNPLM